jgi:hypothetical protein
MSMKIRCGCESSATAPSARREALMVLAALGLGGGTAPTAQAQDPVETQPRSYKLLFENEKVRVIEYVSRLGQGVCGAGKHYHADHVTITLTPAKVKATAADGKERVVDIPAGAAFWESAATHSAELIGGSGARVLMVELKDKDWKPSTG